MKRLLAFFVLLLAIFPAHAQLQLFMSDLQKGFRAIDKNNYDKGIEIFNSMLSRDSSGVGAHYGLAKIYFSKDYKGFDAAKAYSHISVAQRNYATVDEKTSASLSKLGIDQNTIDQLSWKIDDELFSIAAADNSTEALGNFIKKYPNSPNVPAAKELLAQLSFFNANASNSEATLDDFIKKNPGSKDAERAIRTRNMLAFQKAKAANTVTALEDFIRKYPDAEELEEATAALAALEFIEAKKQNTIAAYDSFMTKYPVGLIADETDPSAVSSAIKAVIENRVKFEPSIGTLESVAAIYGWEAQRRKLLELYKTLSPPANHRRATISGGV